MRGSPPDARFSAFRGFCLTTMFYSTTAKPNRFFRNFRAKQSAARCAAIFCASCRRNTRAGAIGARAIRKARSCRRAPAAARDYGRDPYAGYDKTARLFFPLTEAAQTAAAAAGDDLHPKESVLGVIVGGAAKAYPFSQLRENGADSFVDSIGGARVTLRWNADDESARVEAGADIIATRAFWFAWRAFHPATEVFAAR